MANNTPAPGECGGSEGGRSVTGKRIAYACGNRVGLSRRRQMSNLSAVYVTESLSRCEYI